MRFEWDDSKNEGESQETRAVLRSRNRVFDDPLYLSISDCVVGHERRYWAVGLIGSLAVVVVVHTWQEADGEEIVRIVSARKASARERRLYEENENFEV